MLAGFGLPAKWLSFGVGVLRDSLVELLRSFSDVLLLQISHLSRAAMADELTQENFDKMRERIQVVQIRIS